MEFEWDEEKEKRNIQKHGISFETASLVFNDEHRLEYYDREHSIDEDRYITIGIVHKILVVVYTQRCERYRIISARLATASERRFYLNEY